MMKEQQLTTLTKKKILEALENGFAVQKVKFQDMPFIFELSFREMPPTMKALFIDAATHWHYSCTKIRYYKNEVCFVIDVGSALKDRMLVELIYAKKEYAGFDKTLFDESDTKDGCDDIEDDDDYIEDDDDVEDDDDTDDDVEDDDDIDDGVEDDDDTDDDVEDDN